VNVNKGPDTVDAARAEIEVTRAELAETVSELSRRLNPKERASDTAQHAIDSVHASAERGQGLVKDAATKAQGVTRTSLRRVRAVASTRESQLAVAALVGVVGVVVWLRRRGHTG
jgi:cobalamin biosynthesis Mg chelatase CobN